MDNIIINSAPVQEAGILANGEYVSPDEQTEENFEFDFSTTEPGQSLKVAALNYAKAGLPVFPCNPDKTPRVSHGCKDASCDCDTIQRWWNRWPDALIGLRTGTASGMFVLDIDVKNGGEGFASLAVLEKQHGSLPPTFTVTTPSGGEHRYFVMPETDPPLGLSSGKLGPGLDTRGENGYVVVPPSKGINGNYYQFVNSGVELAELPQWVIDSLRNPKKNDWQTVSTESLLNDDTPYGRAALDGIMSEMAEAPEGQRNDTLNRLACRLASLVAGGELSKGSAELIKKSAQEAGLGATEIEKTFLSGFTKGMQSPATAPDGDSSGSVATVANVAAVTKKARWSEPRPLTNKIKAEKYPVDALPDTIRAAVTEVQTFVKAPVAMVASSAIGALSLAVQAHVDVERASNLKSPVGLFLLTIADSGERKSTCDSFFMKTVRDYEATQRKSSKSQFRDYESEHAAWEEQQQELMDKIKQESKDGKDIGDLESNLRDLRELEPEKPRVPKLSYSDTTTEALAYGLAKDWPSAGLISAEAGTVLGSHGMSKESVMKNLAQLNQLWDGTPISIDRRTSESFVVSGARLTIALQIQEATLRSFFSNTGALARGTGFLSRFLMAWPESTQGTRLFKEPPPDWPALEVFNSKLSGLMQKKPIIDATGALLTQDVTLDSVAKKAWVALFDRIESRLTPDGAFFDVRDVASKAADNAARLAAVFHLFEHGFDLPPKSWST
jgi:Bifunctional DNA primase/polymerase, N-terminal.